MSDFLTHLVSRSITPVPSVQPRLASRFEAIAPAADAAFNSSLGAEQLEATSAPQAVSQPTPQVNYPPQRPPSSAKPPMASTDEPPSHRSELFQPVQPLAPQFPEPVVPREAISPQRPAPSGEPRTSAPPPFIPEPMEPPAIAALHTEIVVSENQREAYLQEGRSPAPPAMITVDRLIADPIPPIGTQVAIPRPDLPEPLLTPRQAAPSSVSRSAMSAPEVSTPPPIQVTIGRIEVRATAQAPASKPASAAAKPALSLEQYLQQRAGGRP